jgi:hypothetical protein
MRHHASGAGGARVVIMAASVVLRAVGSTSGGHIPQSVGVGVQVVIALCILCSPPCEFMGVGGT